MNRAAILPVLAMAVLAGCQTGPEQLKVKPLPVEGQPLAYAEVVQRARTLATSATESFYIDKWMEVESAAEALEQTALYLPKSGEIPPVRRASLEAQSMAMIKDAQDLRESARAKDEKKTNETLQRIHLRVRELRPE